MLAVKKTFRIPELKLQSGDLLENVVTGYETFGQLNAAGTNAILVCHYFSATSHCAGRLKESDPEPGYWDAIIGQGKPIDTSKFFVVSADVISNVNAKVDHVVSTGPSSTNPQTGRAYGSTFPVVTISDFVVVQKQLLDSLGVRHLHAVCGPSMGALQSLEWSARFPDFVDRVMPVIGPGLSCDPYLSAQLQQWCDPILNDPDFQNGDYYATGREPRLGLAQTFKLMTLNSLHNDYAKPLFGQRWADQNDPSKTMNAGFAFDRTLRDAGLLRAETTDANAVLRIARANQLFTVEERKQNIRAKFLVIPAATDLIMTPAMNARGVSDLRALGLSVQTFMLEGNGGHLGGVNNIAQASDVIRAFL